MCGSRENFNIYIVSYVLALEDIKPNYAYFLQISISDGYDI